MRMTKTSPPCAVRRHLHVDVGAVGWVVTAAAVAIAALGCQGEAGSGAPTTTAPVSAAPAATPAPTPSATPASSAAAAPKPTHDCPEGSSGDGTLAKPCEAKGTARLMEVTWTGKTSDTGPSFRVVNKAKLDVIYGSVAAYFYDKAGKQLEVKDTGGKTRPSAPCSGKLFDGIMKPGEKAVITFSCIKKENVPDGTAAIEAEMQMVGFANAAGTAIDGYWKNGELTPDARPKGGIKK